MARDVAMEINVSTLWKGLGISLPTMERLKLYKDCGGRLVTIGSDAHTASRVGQYSDRACEILKDIFGYVCTFENRQPIFHKL